MRLRLESTAMEHICTRIAHMDRFRAKNLYENRLYGLISHGDIATPPRNTIGP